MKIGIIGAGNVGTALAQASVRAGHEVTLSAANPEHAEKAAREAGARKAESSRGAAEGAELVVLAIPYTAVDQVLGELGDSVNGKVILDVTNRMNMQQPGLAIDGTSATEQIQARVPGAKVVKAFNITFASQMTEPKKDGLQLDVFVAGDDSTAKTKVLELARDIGFRPIDAGAQTMARALEAMAVLNTALQIQQGLPWQSGWKLVGPVKEAAPARV